MLADVFLCMALAGERTGGVFLARMTEKGPRLIRALEGEMPEEAACPPLPEGFEATAGELFLVRTGEKAEFTPAAEDVLRADYEGLKPPLRALAKLVDACELSAVGEVEQVEHGTGAERAVLDVRVGMPLVGAPEERLRVHILHAYAGAEARVGRKAFFLALDDASGALVPLEGGMLELASDLDQACLVFNLRRLGLRLPPALTTEAATLRAWTECWNSKDFEGVLLCYSPRSPFRRQADAVRPQFEGYPAEVEIEIESIERGEEGSVAAVVATATVGDFVRTSRCRMRFAREGEEVLILDDGFSEAR